MSATVGIGGVTTPEGFRASGTSAGIKASRNLDLALLVSDTPAIAAAVFTTNKAQAAPVVISREHLSASGGVARAIVVNSGCANACTGEDGMRAARDMAAETARLVGCSVAEVLVASTGVIGVALPSEKIRTALPAAFRHGKIAPRPVGEEQLFQGGLGGPLEASPFVDGYQDGRVRSAPRDDLRSIPQAGLQEFAEPRLCVLDWPAGHDHLRYRMKLFR